MGGTSARKRARSEKKGALEELEIGTSHWVSYKEELPRLAEIIERRSVSETSDIFEYYIHYCNFDKRLDEWIPAERFMTSAQAEELHRAALAETSSNRIERTLTRNMRRRFEENLVIPHALKTNLDPVFAELEKEHEEATKVKNIQRIELGKFEIDCWYFSPYPDEYSQQDKLFICEFCLKYMKLPATYARHKSECGNTGPPGRLIYLKSQLAVFEIDSESSKLYCQNLCLLAKLFLDHKTLYYDVSPFMFYVLCEVDEQGSHLVGYFSKEKESADDYNLACIMILPPFQRKGYGRFLIQLSYELTRRQGKTGTPEKPLSDLGLLSYRSFWTFELLNILKRRPTAASSIEELGRLTAFKKEDIIDTLTMLGMTKLWRGQRVINVSVRIIDEQLRIFEGKSFNIMDPDFLSWPVTDHE